MKGGVPINPAWTAFFADAIELSRLAESRRRTQLKIEDEQEESPTLEASGGNGTTDGKLKIDTSS